MLFAGVVAAHGGVTITFRVDQVYDTDGAPVSVSGLGMIIADIDGDGFGAIQSGGIGVGDFIGSSDSILYRADFSSADGTTPGIWFESLSNITLTAGWTQGDALAFVWVPHLTTASLSVSEGEFYGLATYSSWVTPADGGSVTYQLISSTNNGVFTPTPDYPTLQLPDVQLRATNIVSAVPEPSAFALIAGTLGLAFVAGRRRR